MQNAFFHSNEHLKERLSHTIKVLLDVGCIVIIPTTNEENVKKYLVKHLRYSYSVYLKHNFSFNNLGILNIQM